MSNLTKYVLDTNVFIEAYNRYYSFDLVPSFWNTLLKLAAEDHIISIDRVKEELNKEDDKLREWVNHYFNPWFMSTDHEEVIQSYREIMNWGHQQKQYHDYAKREFAEVADSWIVAYGKTYNFVVVTHEQFRADAKKRIPIPNACRAFGVTYMDTFEMLRELKVTLG